MFCTFDLFTTACTAYTQQNYDRFQYVKREYCDLCVGPLICLKDQKNHAVPAMELESSIDCRLHMKQ